MAACISDYKIDPQVTELLVESGVTGIPDCGNWSNLAKVTLPDTLEEIVDNAFANCMKLNEVTLNCLNCFRSYHSKNSYTFANCVNLRLVHLAETFAEIGEGMFFGCSNLHFMNIPNSVHLIDSWAFYNCSSLERIDLHNVDVIGSYAFHGCVNLEQVNVHSAQKVGSFAFYNCTKLRQINFVNVITIEASAFAGCTGISNFDFPHGFQFLGSFAFTDTEITTLTLPDTITEVDSMAFGWMTKLKSLSLPSRNWTLPSDVFVGCIGLESIHLRGDAYNPGICDALTYIGLPNEVNVSFEREFPRFCGKMLKPTPPENKTKTNEWKLAAIISLGVSACGVLAVIVLAIAVMRLRNSQLESDAFRSSLVSVSSPAGSGRYENIGSVQ
jgi:hypothetical protein